MLIFSRDDGLEILTLPPLLSAIAIGSIIGRSRNLLGFADRGLFYVIAIHDLANVSKWGGYGGVCDLELVVEVT